MTPSHGYSASSSASYTGASAKSQKSGGSASAQGSNTKVGGGIGGVGPERPSDDGDDEDDGRGRKLWSLDERDYDEVAEKIEDDDEEEHKDEEGERPVEGSDDWSSKGKQRLENRASDALQAPFQALSIGSTSSAYTPSSNSLNDPYSSSSSRPGPFSQSTSSAYQRSSSSAYPQSSSSSYEPAQPQPTGQNQLSTLTLASLPADVQAHIAYLQRRLIQTGPDSNDAERLDPRESFQRSKRRYMLNCQGIAG